MTLGDVGPSLAQPGSPFAAVISATPLRNMFTPLVVVEIQIFLFGSCFKIGHIHETTSETIQCSDVCLMMLYLLVDSSMVLPLPTTPKHVGRALRGG